jgi:hypothetical protein
MFESARKHGPFDERYPARQKLPAPRWDLRLAGEGEERLEWSAFLARFFANRRRHDFAALAAYEAYRNTLDQRTAQPRTTARRPPRSRPAAAVACARVRVAPSSAAVLAWESEGGASAERPAGI